MQTKRKKITLVLEKTDTGFSAYAHNYPIYTTGKSMLELQKNALEASQLYFEEVQKPINLDDMHFEYDFKQFFQYYKVLNAKFLAKKIGMNPTLLSQYISGIKKPSEAQTSKIIEGIHRIGEELAEVGLVYR